MENYRNSPKKPTSSFHKTKTIKMANQDQRTNLSDSNIQDISKEYEDALKNLIFNSRPQIMNLTELAHKYSKTCPEVIVELIEDRIKSSDNDTIMLSTFYLLDSIMKNLGDTYKVLFEKNIVELFKDVFRRSKDRDKLLVLRRTWTPILQERLLHDLDATINEKQDQNWPITEKPAVSKQIHVSISKENLLSMIQNFFKCDYCGKSFATKYKLEKHKDVIHLNIKQYYCDACQMVYRTHHQLKKHDDLVHSGLTSFACGLCEKTFQRKLGLEIHTKKVHKKFFSCKNCKKAFLLRVTRNQHLKICKSKNDDKDTNVEEQPEETNTGDFEQEIQTENNEPRRSGRKRKEINYNDSEIVEFKKEAETGRNEHSDRDDSLNSVAIENAVEHQEVAKIKTEVNEESPEIEIIPRNLKSPNGRKENESDDGWVNEKIFKCPNCPAKSWNENQIRQHLEEFHRFSLEYQRKINLKIESF